MISSVKAPIIQTLHRFYEFSDYFLSFFNIFIYYVYRALPTCIPAGQKRVPVLITGGCVPPFGCWEKGSQCS